LLEQARHQATELTNATRAEVEQTLEWARGQAGAIIARAQEGAEQLLSAAGLGEEAIDRVAQSIVSAAQAAAESSRGSGASSAVSGPQLREPEPEEPPVSPPVSPGPSPPAPRNEDDTTG
jgi:hypothetical protein